MHEVTRWMSPLYLGTYSHPGAWAQVPGPGWRVQSGSLIPLSHSVPRRVTLGIWPLSPRKGPPPVSTSSAPTDHPLPGTCHPLALLGPVAPTAKVLTGVKAGGAGLSSALPLTTRGLWPVRLFVPEPCICLGHGDLGQLVKPRQVGRRAAEDMGAGQQVP